MKIQRWHIYWKADDGWEHFVGKASDEGELTSVMDDLKSQILHLQENKTHRTRWAMYWASKGNKPKETWYERKDLSKQDGEFVVIPIVYD